MHCSALSFLTYYVWSSPWSCDYCYLANFIRIFHININLIFLGNDVVVMFDDMVRTQQTFVLLKTSWRRLGNFLIKTNKFALPLRLQKTSSRRLGQDQYIRPGHTSSRPPQDVLVKTNIFVLAILLPDLFKTFWRCLQDVFKTYHQVKLFLLTRLWEAFKTFLRRSFPETVTYRGICLSNTSSDKFMVSVPNLQER